MAALAIRKPVLQPGSASALKDVRFRSLLGRAGWEALPAAVRARFSRRLGPGCSATYVGEVEQCRMNLAGWLLAQACRAIGGPLPLGRNETGVAAIVTVTEDGASGGQVWSRLYARPCGFPQVIHSAKRFAGPTGLEEYIGRGFGIALAVEATPRGICFHGQHYFLQLGRMRLRLPDWLAPGRLRIDHEDCGGGSFLFTLDLRHRLLGQLVHQVGRFRDRT